jgi:hypothetical protein
MRIKLLVLLLIVFTSGFSQYNRLIKVNTGVSSEQFEHQQISKAINDTGAVKLDYLSWSPTLSYTHEIMLGQILSVSGNIGFQYMNLYYGPDHYGAPYMYISVNPQVSLYYRKGFEYYVKLRIGSSFYFHNPHLLPDPAQRLMPNTANIFTGVTLGGFNYFINDHFGLNLELSIWSPELATFGVSYRFYRGELPKIQGEDQDNVIADSLNIEKPNQ